MEKSLIKVCFCRCCGGDSVDRSPVRLVRILLGWMYVRRYDGEANALLEEELKVRACVHVSSGRLVRHGVVVAVVGRAE